MRLARVSRLDVLPANSPRPEQAVSVVAGGIGLHLPLAGLVDVAEEKGRIAKELAEVEEHLKQAQARLENPGFVGKAPHHVVEGARRRSRELSEKAAKLRAHLAELEQLSS